MQVPGDHRKKLYVDGHRTAAFRARQRSKLEAKMRMRWASFPEETQAVLGYVLEVGGMELAEAVTDILSVEHSRGQEVMLELLYPEVERLREELAKYQAACELPGRARLQQRFMAIGGRLSYCTLILTVTTTLRQGYEAWAEFADGVNEEILASALAIAQERLEAEAEIDEIVDMKRTAVRQALAMP